MARITWLWFVIFVIIGAHMHGKLHHVSCMFATLDVACRGQVGGRLGRIYYCSSTYMKPPHVKPLQHAYKNKNTLRTKNWVCLLHIRVLRVYHGEPVRGRHVCGARPAVQGGSEETGA